MPLAHFQQVGGSTCEILYQDAYDLVQAKRTDFQKKHSPKERRKPREPLLRNEGRDHRTPSREGRRHPLCGGESETDFTERLLLAIWQATGAYCDVAVGATYVESLPYETYTLVEADYDRLIHEQQEQQNANGPDR